MFEMASSPQSEIEQVNVSMSQICPEVHVAVVPSTFVLPHAQFTLLGPVPSVMVQSGSGLQKLLILSQYKPTAGIVIFSSGHPSHSGLY